jgi:DNA (cytosine-5)-methyltransferase 1
MCTKPKSISLFSGAGGMDIGVIQAGFNVLASIEMDPNCCETLRSATKRERRKTQVLESDVRLVDPKILQADLELAEGELDLLFGGPPCQTFSQIGKQQSLTDERGLLLFEMIRFAEVFHPKAILIENVKGLLSARDHTGKTGGVFKLLLAELEKLDYVPKWKVINAATLGVPQLRERVFIVATKKPNGFYFPDPTHGIEAATPSLFGLEPYVTVGEALKGIPPPVLKGDAPIVPNHVDVTPQGDRSRIFGVPEGMFLAGQLQLPDAQRGKLTKKDTTKFLRTSRAKPANTLRCGEIFFHPTEERYLTPREYMLIHGYPDTYELRGPIRGRSGQARTLDQHRQVANSVPPPVANALATKILEVLRCRKSSKSLDIV